jgi:hypothetical protein
MQPSSHRKIKKLVLSLRSWVIFNFEAALILLQKNAFSLNDSHAFNRVEHTYTQHWQRDAVPRWNCKQKASRISLPLPRLHSAFLFVLCASVAVEVTQLSALKSDN